MDCMAKFQVTEGELARGGDGDGDGDKESDNDGQFRKSDSKIGRRIERVVGSLF